MKIEFKALILGALLASVHVLMPITAQAQCNWNATGRRYIYQVRQDHVLVITLVQEGTAVAGTASLRVIQVKDRTIQGRVTGTIEGDNFSMEIAWPDNLTGVYNARIMPNGKMNGGTYDKRKPNSQQAWRTEEPLTCVLLPAQKSVTPQPPEPIKSSASGILKPSTNTQKPNYGQSKIEPPPPVPGGSAPVSGPSKASPPPPPMKVPGIVASQAIFPSVFAATGFVILTWDAGPDHPYAEVWFKVNNAVDIFLVEQGKGSRQVMVERGKYYTYILTDAGKTLATVGVVGQ